VSALYIYDELQRLIADPGSALHSSFLSATARVILRYTCIYIYIYVCDIYVQTYVIYVYIYDLYIYVYVYVYVYVNTDMYVNTYMSM